MKTTIKYFLFFSIWAMAVSINAQTPQAVKYQTVVRNTTGEILQNQNVSFSFNIHSGTETGIVVYSETHSVVTNEFGLVNLNVGQGMPVFGTFSGIDWGSGSKFLEVEIDPTGGTSYSTMGTTELLSVPYALYAENTANNDDADANPENELQTLVIEGNNLSISDGNTVVLPGSGLNNRISDTDGDTWIDVEHTGDNDSIIFTTFGMERMKISNNGYVEVNGQMIATGFIGDGSGLTGIQGDNMGNHIANQNLQLNGHRISNDGDDEGITVANNGNVGLGTSNPQARLDVAGRIWQTSTGNSVFLGEGSGNSDDLTTNQNVFVGYNAGFTNSSGENNTATGFEALQMNTTGSDNTSTGSHTLKTNTSGSRNTANGFCSQLLNTVGNDNTSEGYLSLFSNISGNNNTANGSYSLYSNIEGFNNTATGFQALFSNTSGVSNTAVGYYSGSDYQGNNFCTFLGYNADANASNYENSTALGSNATVTASNQIRLGDNNIQSLYCKGAYTSTTLNPPNLYVDANGQILRSTSTLTNDKWSILGNAGTISGVNFIGTTDNQSLDIRTNNILRARITTKGQIETFNTGESVFIGEGAGKNDDLSNQNVFVGFSSGFSNTTGSCNVANGNSAFSSNSTGSYNTAYGYHSLFANTEASYNTASGYNSLSSNQNGCMNTATGSNALNSNSSGWYNTANGAEALKSNTSGFYNTAIGQGALYSNISSNANTAVGDAALYNKTSGSTNTAVGYQAAATYSEYYNSTFLGYQADANANGYSNVTAIGSGATATSSNQVRLGDNSITSLFCQGAFAATTPNLPNLCVDDNGQIMRSTSWGSWTLSGNSGTLGDFNFIGTTDNVPLNFRVNFSKSGRIGIEADGSVFFGYQAGLYDDLSDNRNTFIGFQSGASCTTGSNNTATGFQSLWHSSTGYANTALGFQSLGYNTTGSGNSGNGFRALYSNTTGSSNTANGYRALHYNSTGNYNTANGSDAIYNNTTGSNNSAYGLLGLYYNTAGNNNTAIGNLAGYGASGVSFNECTFVGASSYPTVARTNITMLGFGIFNGQCTGNNQVLLGNTAVTQIRAQVSGITTYSDKRFKTHVKEDVAGLDFIMKLKPVTFYEDPTALHKIWGTPDSLINKTDHDEIRNTRFIGFLAQDVEKAAIESNFNFPGICVPKNEKEVYSLRYTDFVMPLVKAVQELARQNENLTTQIEQLTIEINQLKNSK